MAQMRSHGKEVDPGPASGPEGGAVDSEKQRIVNRETDPLGLNTCIISSAICINHYQSASRGCCSTWFNLAESTVTQSQAIGNAHCRTAQSSALGFWKKKAA